MAMVTDINPKKEYSILQRSTITVGATKQFIQTMMYYKSLFSKSISIIAGVSIAQTYCSTVKRNPIHCQSADIQIPSNAEAIRNAMELKKDPYDVVDEDEEVEWDIKKENCSFCRTFLDSPCRVSFQRWSKCVDQAKKHGDDYIGLCKSYTEVGFILLSETFLTTSLLESLCSYDFCRN